MIKSENTNTIFKFERWCKEPHAVDRSSPLFDLCLHVLSTCAGSKSFVQKHMNPNPTFLFMYPSTLCHLVAMMWKPFTCCPCKHCYGMSATFWNIIPRFQTYTCVHIFPELSTAVRILNLNLKSTWLGSSVKIIFKLLRLC